MAVRDRLIELRSYLQSWLNRNPVSVLGSSLHYYISSNFRLPNVTTEEAGMTLHNDCPE